MERPVWTTNGLCTTNRVPYDERPWAHKLQGAVGAGGHNEPVYVALTPQVGAPARWLVQELTDNGEPLGDPREVDLGTLFAIERARPRWLWDSTERMYPGLLGVGFWMRRCHDVALTERILLGRDGRHGAPSGAAAVAARAEGRPVQDDPAHRTPVGEPTLFASDDDEADVNPTRTLRTALRSQLSRIGSDNALKLLVAAESASALAAGEMGHLGLPLRARVHRDMLERSLGPKPAAGVRPAKLGELAEKIKAAFGFEVNPDSAVDLRNAFRRLGFDIESTRSWVIRDLDHEAVPFLLQYKELSRLFSANGWNWVQEWVRDDRFHAEYLPGGVVSGRWAARGGGGLQIPKLVRQAVIAERGKVFVVADAAQLEPRVLAAISGDPLLQAVSASDDLYSALADDGFGGDRAHAKVAMLGAMYGATSGEAGRLLPTLWQRYPAAMACVQEAAHRGEAGDTVVSILGRRSPTPSEKWLATVQAGSMPDATAAQQARSREVARSWGRFTRNFVVQASAADWASVWLSLVRAELLDIDGAELVFFQHDELVVQVDLASAERVSEIAVTAADRARVLVFPRASVATPVRPVVVDCYADAK